MNLRDIIFKYFDDNYEIKGTKVHLTHTYENEYAEEREVEELFGTTEIGFEDWVEERIGVDYQIEYACGTIEYYVDSGFIDDGVRPAIVYPSGVKTYYYNGNQFYSGIHHNELAIMMALSTHLTEQGQVDEYYRKFG